MTIVTRIYVRFTEARSRQAGQTMTEYVLIISAIAIAGYVAYQGLAIGINNVIANVANSLNAA